VALNTNKNNQKQPTSGIGDLMSFGLIAPNDFLKKYLAFQYFDFDRTWWRLHQKHVDIVRVRLPLMKISSELQKFDC